jgi:hypothetical protein
MDYEEEDKDEEGQACSVPAMGRGTKKMAIIITISREYLAKSG